MSTPVQHSLGAILTKLMRLCHINDMQLSKETSVPFTTIARMRSLLDSNPTAASLRPIAAYFGISVSQLLGDEALSLDKVSDQVTKPIQIPVVPWERAIFFLENKSHAAHDIQAWISTDLPVSQSSFCLKINSRVLLHPFGEEGLLIIDPKATPVSMDYVLVKSEDHGSVYLKQILFDGDCAYLMSVNPELKELNKTTPIRNTSLLMGVVIEIRQQSHRVEFENPTLTIHRPLSQISYELEAEKARVNVA